MARMSKGRRWFFLAVFVVWTVLALQWTNVGCDYPEAYLAVVRFGTPEGLEFLPACAGQRCSNGHAQPSAHRGRAQRTRTAHAARAAHASPAQTPRNDPTIGV